nr:helix-turn-helix transcriptional regulator [Micromonospora sp. DSM 115978]
MADRKTPGVYTARWSVDGENWAAVAAALNERMAARRVGQQDLALTSGVSVSTVRLLQHGAGRRVQNKTLAAVSRALGWPDDHLVRVLLTGSQPEPDADEPGLRELSRSLRGIEARLGEICARLAAVERAVGVRRNEG